jgi:SAM-dependent methyltransferase
VKGVPNQMVQEWDSATYDANARFVSDLGAPLIDLLQPRAGERVLDVGCGDGALTAQLVECGCTVVGVDANESQVLAARARGLRGLDVERHRIEELPFVGEFDAVLSNAVLHWVRDQPAALARIARALKPGGRFAAELGGFGNVDRIREALHDALRDRGIDPMRCDPWFFPTVEEYGDLLRRHGFDVVSIVLLPRPTPLPGALSAWLETFAQPFLHAVPAEARASFVEDVTDRVKPVLYDSARGWTADYTRLRFLAHLSRHTPSDAIER